LEPISFTAHNIKLENGEYTKPEMGGDVSQYPCFVAARRVLFWQVTDEHILIPIAGAHGIDDECLAHLRPVPCGPALDDLGSRGGYQDLRFRASRADEPGDFQFVLDTLKVENAIAVPWRAGD